MRDQLISEIDQAQNKLRDAKAWIKDNRLNMAEDCLDFAVLHVEQAIYDIGVFLDAAEGDSSNESDNSK